ncbi:hypothetical protein J6590_061119 [Homalodisca vitripennis]|nr:hypothetical protein J6590_061119 [Homalodisca vitripennis]
MLCSGDTYLILLPYTSGTELNNVGDTSLILLPYTTDTELNSVLVTLLNIPRRRDLALISVVSELREPYHSSLPCLHPVSALRKQFRRKLRSLQYAVTPSTVTVSPSISVAL